ncbi:MAG: hypothetical protein K0S68_745 [Candidatus Saccharibacteria bacterium]|jgi:hypothetical protein|nr:hypothetical protein [Candidatus Saccharibacteria bacterium]
MMKRIFFVLAAAALGFAGLYFRGQNATEAERRADAIVEQDLAGQDPTASIDALKTFVQSHMGASVDFTLTAAYDRDLKAHQAATASADQSQLYTQAQQACSAQRNSIAQAQCVTNYVQARMAAATPAPSPLPEPKLAKYRYDLKAPLWSSDLPGALLLGAVISALFAIAGLFTRRKRH